MFDGRTNHCGFSNSKFNRVATALILSILFLLWASFRPVVLGHDTGMYINIFERYFSENTVRFSGVIFGLIASGWATILNQIPGGREIGGRMFLVFIALIESVLFFNILRKKRPSEAILMAFSYGPLMLLDIIRQGLAMLLAGNFFSSKKLKLYLLVGAFATHIVAVISLLKIRLNNKNIKYVVIFVFIFLFIVFYLFGGLQNKFDYYYRLGSFNDLISKNGFLLGLKRLSIANIFVISFIVFGGIIRGFKNTETIILLILYISSIFAPLLFRLYFFYFFIVSCSRDVLMKWNNVLYIIFNIGYALILLKFSLNAFAWYAPRH